MVYLCFFFHKQREDETNKKFRFAATRDSNFHKDDDDGCCYVGCEVDVKEAA